MKNLVYYLDQPGGSFQAKDEAIGEPGPGEIRLKTSKTSVCQSDVVIYNVGLPRIKSWPAIILHEASCIVDAVGEGVSKFKVGDLVGLGCDIPCGSSSCIYCGPTGTGDWTSCPNTQATGHEFPGFARSHAILPQWFVERVPSRNFPRNYQAKIGTTAIHLRSTRPARPRPVQLQSSKNRFQTDHEAVSLPHQLRRVNLRKNSRPRRG